MKTGTAIVVVAVLAIAAYVIFGSGIQLPTFQAQPGVCQYGGVYPNCNAPPLSGGSQGCAVNPTLVITATNALSPGTAVTTSGNLFRLNGIYTSTTSPTTTGSADAILISSGYLNKLKQGIQITCGSNQVADTMTQVANATQSIYSTSGLLIIGNSATGASVNNETTAATGGSYNNRIHMIGVDKKSTGQMLFIVELTAPLANVSSVSLSGGTPTAVPSGYTRQATNGAVYAWLLPAITGNTAVDYNLAIVASTSHIVDGAVYTRTYSIQPFVETDGTFNSGTAAFDSLNTKQWASIQSYDFLITA